MGEEAALPNVCRACMSREGTFQSVFVSDESTGFTIHLAEMIMAYASVQITFGDGLPEEICLSCAKKASEFYLFKLKCEETDSALRARLGKSPPQPLFDVVEDKQPFDSVFDLDNESVDVIVKPEISLEYDVRENPRPADEPLNDKNPTPVDLAETEAEVVAVTTCDVLVEELSDAKGEIEFRCYTCGVLCSTAENYQAHLADHNKEDSKQKFSCEICKKRFTKNSHVVRHMKIHETVKPFNCDKCNKGFSRAEQLTHHMNVHTGVKPHVCKTCSKGFNQISNLKDHMRTHNGEKPFLCSTCGKGFNQLGNLRQHTVRHSGIKAHLCSICGNGFASKGELCAHLRKHTGARPFVCSICNHGFTTSSSLTKHKRIHSGEKPYECEVCKMKFSRSGILARHKRTHTGEKPYVCKFCTKAFSQSNDLSSHLRIHTGEKPYICDVCGQAFRQSSALKTHKKTHMNKSTVLDSRVVIGMIPGSFINTF